MTVFMLLDTQGTQPQQSVKSKKTENNKGGQCFLHRKSMFLEYLGSGGHILGSY